MREVATPASGIYQPAALESPCREESTIPRSQTQEGSDFELRRTQVPDQALLWQPLKVGRNLQT